jgi:hypothetical protein
MSTVNASAEAARYSLRTSRSIFIVQLSHYCDPVAWDKFDGNQFADDDPYHKILPLITGDTGKFKARIVRFAFDDGTTLMPISTSTDGATTS